jgi:Protein of unknown function with PCYCGC motif
MKVMKIRFTKTEFLLTALALALGACVAGCTAPERREVVTHNATPQERAASSTLAHGPADPHVPKVGAAAARVPAFETDPKNLPATLPPEMFTGMTRAAYQAVKEIPTTIAQLPCYCHCDEGFGHKSLHSCFVDKHASQCAVCVDEALAAHRMEKEGKLSPAEIRERIIAEFSARH